MQRMLALSADLVAQTRKVRILGATGLDLAHVASGRLSGLVQGCVRVWDFAAARVIIEAAGGYFRADRRGPDQWQIVAAAPGIAAQLQDLVDRNDR
jgi:myo-inositol-1(or 4)-monophosphatase